MRSFSYFQPTELLFGEGRLAEIGDVVARFGRRCLLVTTPASERSRPLYERVKELLKASSVETAHFDGVVPNPTTECASAGARLAKEHRADVVVGLGGGSSMDCAKAIAVEATHPGSAWDYLFFKKAPDGRTLPVVAVTTTSGTGSHVTQVSVITNPAERCKSALYHANIFPRAAVVDPELMLTVPPRVTACTGWDAFTHAFETFLHKNAAPFSDLLAQEAICLVARWLPAAVTNGSDLEARSALAWADTLAGLCIANAGVTLPHGMAMAIGGMYPHVAHGEALAAAYPAFTRYTWRNAVDRFARLGRILDPCLGDSADEHAAEGCCAAVDRLLQQIGLWVNLGELKVPRHELSDLAEACMMLPDYRNNPRVADLDDIARLLQQAFVQ